MAKVYTRTGDDGQTALFGGGRVRKDDPRIEAVGAVDELNAALGLVRMELARGGVAPAGLDAVLAGLQNRLFDVGAELATPVPQARGTAFVQNDHVLALEREIDRWDAGLPPLTAFILPGGCAAAAQLHMARGICRQAERRLVELAAAEPVRRELVCYLNRMSDLLFVLARAANQANRQEDVVWNKMPSGARVSGGDR
jgi:cob(I)alamin adenosyltransferase